MAEDTPFTNSDVCHTPSNQRESQQRTTIDRNALLDLIRKHAPLSIYHLKTISGVDYGTLHRIIREFEFCRLIITEYMTNEGNREERIIKIPEVKA